MLVYGEVGYRPHRWGTRVGGRGSLSHVPLCDSAIVCSGTFPQPGQHDVKEAVRKKRADYAHTWLLNAAAVECEDEMVRKRKREKNKTKLESLAVHTSARR